MADRLRFPDADGSTAAPTDGEAAQPARSGSLAAAAPAFPPRVAMAPIISFSSRWPYAAAILSAMLFALTLRAIFDWSISLGITSFIIVHELGHLVVIRALGVRVHWIVFLPFFGAITAHDRIEEDRVRSKALSSAGGLLAGFALVPILFAMGHSMAAFGGVYLTLLNLLPVGPMDGADIRTWWRERRDAIRQPAEVIPFPVRTAEAADERKAA